MIASVTRPFCGDCTRARISAEGKLYTCLFATQGFDLRALLRDVLGELAEIVTPRTGPMLQLEGFVFITSPGSVMVRNGWIPPFFQNFWPALVVAFLVSAVFGVLLGAPTLRLRGDYLAIVTLGFGEIVRKLIAS